MSDIARTIKQREMAFEASYKLNEELSFKIKSRRDRLFGLWAAYELNMETSQADDYALFLTQLNLETPNDDNMIDYVMQDFRKYDHYKTKEELLDLIEDLHIEAQKSILNEFPAALDTDHHI